LNPAHDYDTAPPKIIFAKCRIYKYNNNRGELVGILVKNFLKGKFIKYNGNNGFVHEKVEISATTVDLKCGEVRLTDFIQAFSHWTYVESDHKVLLCDLQGVLNQEGRRPKFELTDPAICTNTTITERSWRYGTTDIGVKGIRSFFRAHKCNLVCKCLGLLQN